MKDTAIAVVGLIVILFLLWAFTPFGRGMINHRAYEIQKTDDATNYNTIKKVEDTARAMIASYESDKLMYEQYINSENSEERSWANQARNRANKTASTYNNYILQNSFVWRDNIPSDIRSTLETIQ